MMWTATALALACSWLVQDGSALSLETRKVQHNTSSDSPATFLGNQTDTPTPPRQVKVWINAFARSGSSTLLSMVEAVGQGDGGKKVFGLFEPTHDWHPEKIPEDLAQLFSCHLADLPPLFGLSNRHTTVTVPEPQDPKALKMACRQSDVVAIKTINFGHDLQREVLPMLERDPDLKVLYLVRDPRGILASQQTTPGEFTDATTSAMQEMCGLFHRSAELQHPRVKQVVFEELVTAPDKTAAAIYEFLGLPPLGQAQHAWVEANFNATCESPWRRAGDWLVWMFGGSLEAYSDCRPDAASAQDTWRHALSTMDLEAFNTHQPCLAAAAHYHWPTGIVAPDPIPIQHGRLLHWLVVLTSLTLISAFVVGIQNWWSSSKGG
mmetsp:Transcript_52047/g.123929  ORF Transcript_52047/g.123929 Transcript_52047/m.123929 type:complete len:379 (-) Transcript_52047:64-1200(-)